MPKYAVLMIALLGCNKKAQETASPPEETETETETPGTDDPAAIDWLAAGEPAVAPPNIPWLADGAPPIALPSRACPAGWTETPLDRGGHYCNPWPSGARAECEPLQMHVPGTAECVDVGAECPAGAWPADLVDADTVFVAAGANGVGTRASPFGSLADAVEAASPGDTIAIGAGTFEAGVTIDVDVTLRGLCPGETTLTRTAGANDSTGVVVVDGGSVTIRDLRLGDSAAIGVLATDATVALDGVVIDAASNHGVSATDSEVSLTDVLIANIASAQDLTHGDGVFATGGSLVADRLGVTNSHRAGIWGEGDLDMEVQDFVVWGMRPEAVDDSRGVALRHSGSGTAEVRRVSVDTVFSYAVGATSTGDLLVEDAYIRDIAESQDSGLAFGAIGSQGTGALTVRGATTILVPYTAIRNSYDAPVGPLVAEDIVALVTYRPSKSTFGGLGMVITRTPDATISRVYIEGGDADGIDIEYSTATLSDITVDGGGLLGGAGAGINIQLDSDVVVTRAQVFGAPNTGVHVSGATADLSDLYVNPEGASEVGFGAQFVDGADVTARAVLIENAMSLAINVDLASARIEDAVLRHTVPSDLLPYGIPINTYAGGATGVSLSLYRVLIEDGYGSGVTGDTYDLVAEDVRITGIKSLEGTGQHGFGIDAASGSMSLTRVVIGDVAHAGVFHGYGDLSLTDVSISGVAQQACVAASCADDDAASGVFVGGDTATLERVLVEGAVGVGVHLQGTGVLTDVVIRDNGVGIDAVNGTVEKTRVTLEGNGVDEADAATTTPNAVW